MWGLNTNVKRGQDEQQVLPSGFICQLAFSLQVYQMKIDMRQGGIGSTPFPPLQTGVALSPGHILAFYKTAVLQKKALSQSLPALENLN